MLGLKFKLFTNLPLKLNLKKWLVCKKLIIVKLFI